MKQAILDIQSKPHNGATRAIQLLTWAIGLIVVLFSAMLGIVHTADVDAIAVVKAETARANDVALTERTTILNNQYVILSRIERLDANQKLVLKKLDMR